MTDENLDLMIFALSTPCWDLCDKTRLEIFDMAKELKRRRERAWNNISEDIVKASSQKITYGQYMAKRRLSHDA